MLVGVIASTDCLAPQVGWREGAQQTGYAAKVRLLVSAVSGLISSLWPDSRNVCVLIPRMFVSPFPGCSNLNPRLFQASVLDCFQPDSRLFPA